MEGLPVTADASEAPPALSIRKQKKLQRQQQHPHKKRRNRLSPATRAAQAFPKQKQEVLEHIASCDLSPKGSVDVKCRPIIQLLNDHPDYVTTSSCSGRISLFHSQEDTKGEGESKRGGPGALGWLFVKHGIMLPEEMERLVCFLCGEPSTEENRELDRHHRAQAAALVSDDDPAYYTGEVEGALLSSPPAPMPTHGTVSLKIEPFVLHVQCRHTGDAKRLLNAAIGDSGYRNSGMLPPGKKVMCGIRTAAGLGMEVPVVLDGVNFVQHQRGYVWALLHRVNGKMRRNEERTLRLHDALVVRLQEKDSDADEESEATR